MLLAVMLEDVKTWGAGGAEVDCYIATWLPHFAPGEVAEWSKAQHWKCCIGATLSRVRIPPSPFQSRP